MRIVYLFTCFPVQSETFLQREIRAMRKRDDVEIELWSLWRGESEWEGMPIRRYPFASIFRVIFLKIALWAWRRPGVLRRVWAAYMSASPPDLLNIGENLLGLAFALDKASEFRARPPDLIHAVWGTMPAAAAWLLHELTAIPFTMGAHAYDIFRHDGDWTLRHKLACARLIHTTTDSARARLIDLGIPPGKIHIIRRGMEIPAERPFRTVPVESAVPLRILSVGRLVPKKGFFQQIEIYRALRDAAEVFTARIVGGGPLLRELRQRVASLGLEKFVTFTGALEYTEIPAQYEWADALFFTGIVAGDGDRDGLPNVIPEAMAYGVSVLTTPVSGTTEAIEDGVTGQVIVSHDVSAWVAAVRRLRFDSDFADRTRTAARAWVVREFDAAVNSASLSSKLIAAAQVSF
jgi:glycosyltransferase involved in cell wall biosynthesis